MLNTRSGNTAGNGCASALTVALTRFFSAIDRPSEATTMGSTPCFSIWSTTPRLYAAPCRMIDTPTAITNDGIRPNPNRLSPVNMKNAGNMTNSPCAKLMLPLVCQSSVKPIATSA